LLGPHAGYNELVKATLEVINQMQADGRKFMSKAKLRERMRSLSIDEKIRILEKLRDRSLVIAAGGLRQKPERGVAGEVSRKKGI